MDIASLISAFSSGTFTVTRTARGDIMRGRIAAGTTSSITITAAWHPASGRDMQRLPEGREIKDTRVIYTTTLLYAGGRGQAYEADKVSIEGVDWEVQHLDVWQDGSSSRTCYRAIVQVDL